MVSALASMECRPSKPFPELAILDSGAQVSIFNDELFFDESTMQATSTVIQGIGNKKVVSRKGIVDIMVQCPETEQEVRWRFLALCCPSCPVNLIALSAIGDGKRQKLNFWNSRKGWNGEFTINSPDGKTHKMCAKEHPRMKGIVCVEVLGATHSLTVGAPKKPDKTDAQVRALPKEVRVHTSLTKALTSMIAEDGTWGAQELEEATLSRSEPVRGATLSRPDSVRGANELEANPLSRENTARGARELNEATLSRSEPVRGATLSRPDSVRGANDLEANPLSRENTARGVRELEEEAYKNMRKNQHQHAALGHYADVRKLKHAVDAGMISLSGVRADFFRGSHAHSCPQCALTNTRGHGISHSRVDTSKVAPFAHFKCDFVFATKMELGEGKENLATILGHTQHRNFLSQESLMPKMALLVVDVSTRMAFSASCKSKNEPDVHKATESILTQIRGIAANMRILTRDPMYCSVHLFSGDDDRSIWAGVKAAVTARGGLFETTNAIAEGDIGGHAVDPTAQENNMAYAQAVSNGINEANGRAIRRIWRSTALQSSHIYLSQFLMMECYHHSVRISNILPKTDENKEAYTPYNRLTGGTAPGNAFYPFGVIGYYIDRKEPKTSPVRRRPCLYLSTLLEPPRPGNGKPHYQFLVLDWLHAQNNQPQHWKQRTIYASFIRHDTAPVDIRSAFQKYEAELTQQLAPLEAALSDVVKTAQPLPRQPVRTRPPQPQQGTGGAQSSDRLVEIEEPSTTRGGVVDDAEREKEVTEEPVEAANAEITDDPVETAKAKNDKGAQATTTAVGIRRSTRIGDKQIETWPNRTRSSQREKSKPVRIIAGVAKLPKDAPIIEKLAEENDERTEKEVFTIARGDSECTRELTGMNARRDVMWMDMESKIDEVVDAVSAYQVFDVAETRREAPPRRSPEWDEPINKELQVLEDNEVFELVWWPAGHRRIERIEVIRTVRDDGSLRARICFNGKGQDVFTYSQTSSPVAPTALIRLVFAICAARGKPPRGGDFSSAYLHVPEEKEIFAQVFEEYKNFKGKDIDYTGKVLKLKKKLYGAKSSGLGWYEHLRELLQRGGFYPHPVEPTLFIGDTPDEDGDIPLLMTVVDDFVVSASEKVYLKLVKHFEVNGYTITGKGITRRFAGINVAWDESNPHVIKLDQTDKLKFIATDYGEQHGAKKRNTPLKVDYDVELDKEYEPTPEQTTEYRSLLGKLMHCAVVSTLPLAFATAASARVMSRPKPKQYQQLLQTVGYLKNEDRKEFTIKYDFSECPRDVRLYAFSDASFADDAESSKSTVGFIVCAGGAAIHWKSGLMTSVATSTASSERDAAFRCGKTIDYYTHILETIGYPQHAVRLFIDNRTTITGMLNCIVDSQRRHERVSKAWLHDVCMKLRYVQPFYVETSQNIADVMTKACASGGMNEHRSLLLRATGHHEGSWITWVRKLTNATGAFQKNDNLVKVEDYHEEVRDICSEAGVQTSNLA